MLVTAAVGPPRDLLRRLRLDDLDINRDFLSESEQRTSGIVITGIQLEAIGHHDSDVPVPKLQSRRCHKSNQKRSFRPPCLLQETRV